MARPLKIAIGVHGRFWAFDVARALGTLGQNVTLFTNYPSYAAKRFGVTNCEIRSFTVHGLLTRALSRIASGKLLTAAEPALHQWFGAWLARHVPGQLFDVVDLYSGIAEETLQRRRAGVLRAPCLLERGSAHIRYQKQLLEQETKRVGAPQEVPSAWMVSREEREYALADKINVLSTFAHRSFTVQGILDAQLTVTPLGVDTSRFRASVDAIAQRRLRILGNKPLRVVYAGQVSFRKGLWDLFAVSKAIPAERFELTLVGTVTAEAKSLIQSLPAHIRIAGHQFQDTLPDWYANADIFLFPTLEDGFAVVLAQAQAAGLPIIATTNCSAPDFVEEGKSGWIVPIRSPESIIERLLWCDANRPALADMVTYTYEHPYVRDWLNVGRNYLSLMQEMVAER